jgi:hypothetical protein
VRAAQTTGGSAAVSAAFAGRAAMTTSTLAMMAETEGRTF